LNGSAPTQPPADKLAQDANDERDPFNLRVDSQVDGRYLKAYLVAYESFKAEAMIPEVKRKIENYGVELRQDKDFYFVLFLARRKPSEARLRGGESELGVDVMYTVRKTNYELISKKFFE
jgi:hypothetical protein